MLVLMNILDLVYTNVMLFLDNTNEANPLMAYIFYQYGIEGMVLVKGVFLVSLGVGLRYLPNLKPAYTRMFFICVAAYGMLSIYHGYWFLHTLKIV